MERWIFFPTKNTEGPKAEIRENLLIQALVSAPLINPPSEHQSLD